MGYRTVVILANDHAHEWENDPELGKKIWRAANTAAFGMYARNGFYGNVIECTHADNQTLGILDGYIFTPLSYGIWTRSSTQEQMKLDLLKQAAEKMGYRLVAKRKPKK